MKIFKYKLSLENKTFIKMPEKSAIMDIQMQDGIPVMWALVDPESREIKVKINMYGTGGETHKNGLKDEYISTVQDGFLVWHFFMNYE